MRNWVVLLLVLRNLLEAWLEHLAHMLRVKPIAGVWDRDIIQVRSARTMGLSPLLALFGGISCKKFPIRPENTGHALISLALYL